MTPCIASMYKTWISEILKRLGILVVYLSLFLGMPSSTYGQASAWDSGVLQFEFIKNKVIIPVTINKKTYRFLLDTGGIFEISEELQTEYSFDQVDSTSIVDINRKRLKIKTVIVPEINLGSRKFENRKAIVTNLSSTYPYSCFGLDGMIGRDFLDEVLLQFDLNAHELRISKNTVDIHASKEDRTKLKLSKRGLPSIRLRINGKKERIEFDSGSGDFYSPKTSEVASRFDNAVPSEILSFYGEFSFGITMQVEPTTRFREKVESLQLANVTFTNFYSQFSKPSAARLGASILKYGKVTLDYKKGWFYYEPYEQQSRLPDLGTFGFGVAVENGQYIVKWVLKSSQADQFGLHQGHLILSVDDYNTTNIVNACEQYLNGYPFKMKQSIRVKYLDDRGELQIIELTKMNYN